MGEADEEYSHLQLIDENGVLNNAGLETFAKEVKLAECGLSYAIVSIMGPQSSGKSTLLNHLFGTKFREMDALEVRGQTTQGIWLAKCAGIEPCTLVMDLEGSDGTERGQDSAFEKQAALFALAVSDIILINMWCHDIGREQASNKPLLRTVFEVMGKLLGFRKTTLLFVIRDKTKSPMKVLESLVSKEIEQIWDSFDKPDGVKETPLSEIFNVKIVALSNYEEKEDQFKDQVASLRQECFNSVTLGSLAGDGRIPGSGFSFSAEEIWKTIKENKDLNLPAHKVMVATVRCEQIASEKLKSFVTNEDWCQLEKAVQSHRVPRFAEKLSSLLDTCLTEYDVEAKCFDTYVRTEKRRELVDKLLHLVEPAYQSMLEHIRFQTLVKFKEAFEEKLNGGDEFAVAARDSTNSFMIEFDESCSDVIIKQANWDSSKLHNKLQDDIDAHVAGVRSSKLSEILAKSKENLKEVLSGHVKRLLAGAHDGTWHEIWEYYSVEMVSTNNDVSKKVSGFRMDEYTLNEIFLELQNYARGVIEEKARLEAASVLARMMDRFERFFSLDSNSKLRVWSGSEDIEAMKKTACSASLKLLSIMAAIREGEDADDIENTLFRALMPTEVNNNQFDPLDSDTWEEVPESKTLITPILCKDHWMQFSTDSETIVSQAQEACSQAKRSFASGIAVGVAGAAAGGIAAAGGVAVASGTIGGAEAFNLLVVASAILSKFKRSK